MLVIGLTGGVASGKTTVSEVLREEGAILIDADQIAREPGSTANTGLARVGQGIWKRDFLIRRGPFTDRSSHPSSSRIPRHEEPIESDPSIRGLKKK